MSRGAQPCAPKYGSASSATPRNVNLGGKDSMRKAPGALKSNHAEHVRGPKRVLQDRRGK